MTQHIYSLPLLDSGAPNVPDEFVYLPPPTDPAYILQFEIEGTSSVCREGSLWINIPESGKAFSREAFREYKYVLPLRIDDFCSVSLLTIRTAGFDQTFIVP